MSKFNILTQKAHTGVILRLFEPLSVKIRLISRRASENESINKVGYLVTLCCKSFATNSTFKRFLS